jgi:hypothetical protein
LPFQPIFARSSATHRQAVLLPSETTLLSAAAADVVSNDVRGARSAQRTPNEMQGLTVVIERKSAK